MSSKSGRKVSRGGLYLNLVSSENYSTNRGRNFDKSFTPPFLKIN